ncbi:MAG TPA: metal ABC transporter permease [Tepidiformaceae bacterium]|nr:metal ABC transporter permease [Tepidiformaceae bacterium]
MTEFFAAANPAGAFFDMFSHPFMRYAFISGTAVGVAAGLVSYFAVLRGEVFTGDALGHAAFTGALVALAIGIDLRFGLFAAAIGVALLFGVLGARGRANDVVIGSVFAWVLGLGVLFLALYTTSESSGDSSGGVRVLFGSILGLDGGQARATVVVAMFVVAVLIAIARPLLFASVDEAVAAGRGLPVRAIGLVFLGVVGVTAAEASQAVGALLILGLLAAPGGAASQLTSRPFLGLALSGGIAVVAVWTGLTLSYFVPACPPSFSILAVVAAFYVLAAGGRSARHFAGRWQRLGAETAAPQPGV